MLGEAPRLGVAEEQSADHFARPGLDGHGEIAAHRQVARAAFRGAARLWP